MFEFEKKKTSEPALPMSFSCFHNQLWMEDHAFSAVMQRRLSETNEKVIQCVMTRLGGLSKA